MPDTEFNRKYPPDPWGEEAAPNARVWKIYRDQQDVSHKSMLHGWNKTLDVLLIFAGLFSAVLTAFLIESYKVLQPDYTQYVATFLYAAALSHNRTGGVFPTMDSIVAPDRFIQASARDRWTNGLWFTGLFISLTVALLCILIKQWLDAYDSHILAPAPSSLHWARRHTLYHRGLKKWGVPGLISFLPLLLHMSLFLFFVGLILFLHPLDSAISYFLLLMVFCIAEFYALSLALPAWRIDCPSYTPLLAQAPLAVSWAISGLVYIFSSLKLKLSHSSRDVAQLLSHLAQLASDRLESIRRRAMQQLARERLTISTCDRELDGYVLSALINMPTDANREVVNTAIAALGAITSDLTIDVISRKSLTGFADKLVVCHENIPSMRTGFGMASHAQLRRAHLAMQTAHHLNWPCPPTPGIFTSLGIDGLLLQTFDIGFPRRRSIRLHDNLIHQLQSLPLAGHTSSSRFPLRSICLLFLVNFSMTNHEGPEFLSCFLLVFCAGRFAIADRHERLRALRSVDTFLRTRYALQLPEHIVGEADYILAVVNRLWVMLAEFVIYCNGIDSVTQQIVAYQAVVYFQNVSSSLSGFEWRQISGLFDFVLSRPFAQCAGTADTLSAYISLFLGLRVLDHAAVPLENYWVCIHKLWRMSWEFTPRPKYAGHLSLLWYRCPTGPSRYDWGRPSPGRHESAQNNCYESALSALLASPAAIATWPRASSPDLDEEQMDELATLADRIASVLCLRKHRGCADDAFISGFFSGPFLLARFRDLVSREGVPGDEDRVGLQRVPLRFAKHCLELAPDAFLSICAELERLGDEGSALRARAVAIAQRMRDGSMPGGVLSAQCDTDCDCVPASERRRTLKRPGPPRVHFPPDAELNRYVPPEYV